MAEGVPASVLGVDWMRAIRGPFPEIKLVATGGITLANAASFLAAGADAVSLGAAFADPDALDQVAALMTRASPATAPRLDTAR